MSAVCSDARLVAITVPPQDLDTQVQYDYGWDEELRTAYRMRNDGLPEMAFRLEIPPNAAPTDSVRAVWGDGDFWDVAAISVAEYQENVLGKPQGKALVPVMKRPAAAAGAPDTEPAEVLIWGKVAV